ncbi:MAG: isochorismatase family protein [Pelistega sp.]|nr:isochorismatase family protein [Pelistega sp.]
MLLKTEECIFVMIDIQTKLMTAIDSADKVIQCAEALVKTAQLLNIPVITTEHYPEKIGSTVTELSPYRGEVVNKTTFSAVRESIFVETLHKISEAGHRHQVLFFGCETHVCVLQSLLDTVQLGNYQCHLIVDACGSRKDSDKTLALTRAKRAGVSLLSTEMVLFECLESGEHPHFKAVMKLIKSLN